MWRRQNLLTWVLVVVFICDIALTNLCFRIRRESKTVAFKVQTVTDRLVAAYEADNPKRDIVRRYDWRPEDFFDAPDLIEACVCMLNDDEAGLRRLIDTGMDVNASGEYGFTLLFWAFSCENLNAFEVLLSSGADPNRQLERGMATGLDGYLYTKDTVLFASARRAKDLFLLAGLKYAQNVNQMDIEGNNLLHVAKGAGVTDAILLALIAAGFDVNAKSNDRTTPIWDSLVGNEFSTVLCLLNAGARPEDSEMYGGTFSELVGNKIAEFEQKDNKQALQQLHAIKNWMQSHIDPESDLDRVKRK